jgi:hypothetical protein
MMRYCQEEFVERYFGTGVLVVELRNGMGVEWFEERGS